MVFCHRGAREPAPFAWAESSTYSFSKSSTSECDSIRIAVYCVNRRHQCLCKFRRRIFGILGCLFSEISPTICYEFFFVLSSARCVRFISFLNSWPKSPDSYLSKEVSDTTDGEKTRPRLSFVDSTFSHYSMRYYFRVTFQVSDLLYSGSLWSAFTSAKGYFRALLYMATNSLFSAHYLIHSIIGYN